MNDVLHEHSVFFVSEVTDGEKEASCKLAGFGQREYHIEYEGMNVSCRAPSLKMKMKMKRDLKSKTSISTE